jgi:hypothetical protein
VLGDVAREMLNDPRPEHDQMVCDVARLQVLGGLLAGRAQRR